MREDIIPTELLMDQRIWFGPLAHAFLLYHSNFISVSCHWLICIDQHNTSLLLNDAYVWKVHQYQKSPTTLWDPQRQNTEPKRWRSRKRLHHHPGRLKHLHRNTHDALMPKIHNHKAKEWFLEQTFRPHPCVRPQTVGHTEWFPDFFRLPLFLSVIRKKHSSCKTSQWGFHHF